jgi:hypothetical protein
MDFWDFLWSSLLVFFYVAVIVMWFVAIFDLFSRHDLSGWMKALWLAIIIFLPVFGVLAYFIFRPVTPEQAMRPYSRDWQVGELQTLVRMRDQGTITDAEFNTMKQRIITETPVTGTL